MKKVLGLILLIFAIALGVGLIITFNLVNSTTLLLFKIIFYASLAALILDIAALVYLFARTYNTGFSKAMAILAGVTTIVFDWWALSTGKMATESYHIDTFDGVIYAQKDGAYSVYRVEAFEDVVIRGEINGLPVKSIDKYAMKDTSKLKNLTFNGGSIEIGENSFTNCKYLETITFAEGGSYIIAKDAFSFCSFLHTVTIEGKASLYGNPFHACSALSDVYVDGGELNGKLGYCFDGYFNGTIHLNDAAMNYISDSLKEIKISGDSSIKSGIIVNGNNTNMRLPDYTNVYFADGFDFNGAKFLRQWNTHGIPYYTNADEYHCIGDNIFLPSSITNIPAGLFGDSGNGCNVYYKGSAASWSAVSVDAVRNSNYHFGKKVSLTFNSSFAF